MADQIVVVNLLSFADLMKAVRQTYGFAGNGAVKHTAFEAANPHLDQQDMKYQNLSSGDVMTSYH